MRRVTKFYYYDFTFLDRRVFFNDKIGALHHGRSIQDIRSKLFWVDRQKLKLCFGRGFSHFRLPEIKPKNSENSQIMWYFFFKYAVSRRKRWYYTRNDVFNDWTSICFWSQITIISTKSKKNDIFFHSLLFLTLKYLFHFQLLISYPDEKGITWLVFCDYIRHKLGPVFRASFSKQIGAPFHLYIENETIDSIDCT